MNYYLNITNGNVSELLQAQKPVVLELKVDDNAQEPEYIMLHYDNNDNVFLGYTRIGAYVFVSPGQAYIQLPDQEVV